MRTIAITLCLAVSGALVGCASGGGAEPSAGITVFAAASLKNTFTELGEVFEQQHHGAGVEFVFAGSSDLAAQLLAGAPADVFASADQANMDKVAAGALVGDPVPFAANTLTIVTAPGNPRGVDSFDDLADPGLLVVVCAPQVPCGAATAKAEEAAGVDLAPVSEEASVTDVLGKVVAGQADAGLVYVTDAAAAAGRVAQVDFPEAAGIVNTYPIAVVGGAGNAAMARAFLELVTGPQGRRVLAGAGFREP